MKTIKCLSKASGTAMPSSNLSLPSIKQQTAFRCAANGSLSKCTRRLLTLVFLAWTAVLSAQKLNWVLHPSAPNDRIIGGDEHFNDMDHDAAGNLLVTGSFEYTADFDPGPNKADLTAVDSLKDIFVAKYDAAGKYLWAFRLGNDGRDEGFGISTDANGNVYVTGTFVGLGVDFDPGPGTALLSGTDAQSTNTFVAKYSPSGGYLWAFGIQSDSIVGRCIQVDGNGDVWVAGSLYPGSQAVDFDPGPGSTNLNTGTNTAFFMAKYTGAGAYQWVRSVGNAAGAFVTDMALDGKGNVLLAGTFFGSIDIDPGPGMTQLTDGGNGDGFVAAYDPSSLLVWAFALQNSDSCTVNGIAVDANGNLFVTGQFYGAGLDLDPGAGTASVSSLGESDIFLAQYNASGAYQWGFSTGSEYADEGRSVAADKDGNVVLSGYFSGLDVDFDLGAGAHTLSTSGEDLDTDIFVAKYTANGDHLWAATVQGNGRDAGNKVLTDENGNVYAAGYFAHSNVDFDPGAAEALLSAGYIHNQDGFIWRLTKDGGYAWAIHAGLYGRDYGNTVCARMTRDAAGNIYIAGLLFGYNVDMDPGPGEALLSATGELSDLYFAKYDKNGNYVWAKRVGGVGFDYGMGIAVDNDGNVYLLGSATPDGSFDYDPGPGEAIFTTDPGSWLNSVLAKYDKDGNYLWSKVLQYCDPRALAVDGNGNAYFAGQFFGVDVDFDPGPGTAYMSTVDDDYNIFMTKFDKNGNYVWAKSMGGSHFESVWDIALDPGGNVCITGDFGSEDADFDPGPGKAILPYLDQSDSYLAKYTSDGEYLWAISIVGKDSEESHCVAVDDKNNIYIAGGFFGTEVDFDPGPGTAYLNATDSTTDIFIAKYSPQGTLIWAKDLGTDEKYEQAWDLSIDATGALYMAGDYRSGNNSQAGKSDIFVGEFDADGNFVAYAGSGITTYCVHASGDGDVLIGGSFYDTVDFDPGADVLALTSDYLYSDFFVVSYDFSGLTGTTDPADSGAELLQNRPNPFKGQTRIGFVLPEACEAQLRVFDASGRELFSKTKNYAEGKHEEMFDATGMSGVLWYELATPFGVVSKKMIVLGDE